jgi:hypothetical protein
MGELKLPTNVLSLGAVRASKGEAESRPEAKANGYRPGAMEPPLPLTPERLELIKAYAAHSLRHTRAPSASQMAQRFAPRAQAAAPSGNARPAGQMPLAPPLFALASGIRTLAAVLILVAVLPNAILGAIFWLRLSEAPWSQPVAPQTGDGPTPVLQSSVASPVLSAPAMLEAIEGETVAFPLALDGTDGVPAGSTIVIRGLPPGGSLLSGRRSGETEWILEPDEIGDLHLALQEAGPSEAKLTIQLLAPNNGILADSATTLTVAAGAKAGIAPSAVDSEPSQAPVAEQEFETSSIEEGQAEPDAAMSVADAVPLPIRRPAPGATDDGRTGWVKPSAYVNLRKSPSSSAPVDGVVAKGAKLRVMARKRGWVQVTNPATSQSGWIYSGNIETVP